MSIRGRPLLTKRELDVLRLVGDGYIYEEIGWALGISVKTVAFHLQHCYTKLDEHKGIRAFRKAQNMGLIRAHGRGKCRRVTV